MITKEELIKLVKIESENLKKFATKEELNKLDFSKLIPSHAFNCIYGQMTGYCFSHRAKELIDKCCIKFFDSVDFRKNKYNVYDKSQPFSQFILRNFSSIEFFIITQENKISGNSSKLIEYLKDESDILILT